MNFGELVSPGGAIALVVALSMAWLRFREDRPRIKALEAEKAATDQKFKEIREENAGLVAMVRERLDFTTAVKVMSDVVASMKIQAERHDAHMRATSEEHSEMIAVLRDLRLFMSRLTPSTPGPTGPRGERGEKGDHGQSARGSD